MLSTYIDNLYKNRLKWSNVNYYLHSFSNTDNEVQVNKTAVEAFLLPWKFIFQWKTKTNKQTKIPVKSFLKVFLFVKLHYELA